MYMELLFEFLFTAIISVLFAFLLAKLFASDPDLTNQDAQAQVQADRNTYPVLAARNAQEKEADEHEEEEKIIEVDAVALKEDKLQFGRVDPIELHHHKIMEQHEEFQFVVDRGEELYDKRKNNKNNGLLVEERIVDKSNADDVVSVMPSVSPIEFVVLELEEENLEVPRTKQEQSVVQKSDDSAYKVIGAQLMEERNDEERTLLSVGENYQEEIITHIESKSHVLDQEEESVTKMPEQQEQSVTKLPREVEIAQESYFEDKIGIPLPKDQVVAATNLLVEVKEAPLQVPKGIIGDDTEIDGWIEINRSEVDKQFDKAKAFAASDGGTAALSKLGSDVQLQLYGLHKVAMEGPFHDSSKQLSLSHLSFPERLAWQKLGNMTPEEAMGQYVNLLSEEIPGWEIEQHKGSYSTEDCNATDGPIDPVKGIRSDTSAQLK